MKSKYYVLAFVLFLAIVSSGFAMSTYIPLDKSDPATYNPHHVKYAVNFYNPLTKNFETYMYFKQYLEDRPSGGDDTLGTDDFVRFYAINETYVSNYTRVMRKISSNKRMYYEQVRISDFKVHYRYYPLDNVTVGPWYKGDIKVRFQGINWKDLDSPWVNRTIYVEWANDSDNDGYYAYLKYVNIRLGKYWYDLTTFPFTAYHYQGKDGDDNLSNITQQTGYWYTDYDGDFYYGDKIPVSETLSAFTKLPPSDAYLYFHDLGKDVSDNCNKIQGSTDFNYWFYDVDGDGYGRLVSIKNENCHFGQTGWYEFNFSNGKITRGKAAVHHPSEKFEGKGDLDDRCKYIYNSTVSPQFKSCKSWVYDNDGDHFYSQTVPFGSACHLNSDGTKDSNGVHHYTSSDYASGWHCVNASGYDVLNPNWKVKGKDLNDNCKNITTSPISWVELTSIHGVNCSKDHFNTITDCPTGNYCMNGNGCPPSEYSHLCSDVKEIKCYNDSDGDGYTVLAYDSWVYGSKTCSSLGYSITTAENGPDCNDHCSAFTTTCPTTWYEIIYDHNSGTSCYKKDPSECPDVPHCGTTDSNGNVIQVNCWTTHDPSERMNMCS